MVGDEGVGRRVLLAHLSENDAAVFSREAASLGLSLASSTNCDDFLRLIEEHAGPVPLLAVLGQCAEASTTCALLKSRITGARIVVLCHGVLPENERAAVAMGADVAYGCSERTLHVLAELGSFARQSLPDRLKVVGPLAVDKEARSVWFAGSRLVLTELEFALISELLANYPSITTKAQAKAACAMPKHCNERNAEWHIHNIRVKLNPVNPKDTPICVKWGKGWYLDPNWAPSNYVVPTISKRTG
jgi:DNA-binding response OmpR family regulator